MSILNDAYAARNLRFHRAYETARDAQRRIRPTLEQVRAELARMNEQRKSLRNARIIELPA